MLENQNINSTATTKLLINGFKKKNQMHFQCKQEVLRLPNWVCRYLVCSNWMSYAANMALSADGMYPTKIIWHICQTPSKGVQNKQHSLAVYIIITNILITTKAKWNTAGQIQNFHSEAIHFSYKCPTVHNLRHIKNKTRVPLWLETSDSLQKQIPKNLTAYASCIEKRLALGV